MRIKYFCRLCNNARYHILNKKRLEDAKNSLLEIAWHEYENEVHISFLEISKDKNVKVMNTIRVNKFENIPPNLIANKIFPLETIEKKYILFFRKTRLCVDFFIVRIVKKVKNSKKIITDLERKVKWLRERLKHEDKFYFLDLIKFTYPFSKPKIVVLPFFSGKIIPIRITGIILDEKAEKAVYVNHNDFVIPFLPSLSSFYEHIPIQKEVNINSSHIKKIISTTIIKYITLPLLLALLGIAVIVGSLFNISLIASIWGTALISSIIFYIGKAKYTRYGKKLQSLISIKNLDPNFWSQYEVSDYEFINEEQLTEEIYQNLALALMGIKTGISKHIKTGLATAFERMLQIFYNKQTIQPFNIDDSIKLIIDSYRLNPREINAIKTALFGDSLKISVFEGARIYNKIVDIASATRILEDLTKIPIEASKISLSEITPDLNAEMKMNSTEDSPTLPHNNVININGDNSKEVEPIFYTITDDDEFREVLNDLKDQVFLIFAGENTPTEEDFNNNKLGTYISSVAISSENKIMIILTNKKILSTTFDIEDDSQTTLLFFDKGNIKLVKEDNLEDIREKIVFAEETKIQDSEAINFP